MRIYSFGVKNFSVYLTSIGNSTVSSAIWEKHARVSEFFKNVQNLCVFEKLTRACFSQISREIILLLDNNLYIEMIETR